MGVFGLSSKTTQDDLHREFSKFGELDKVDLVLDRQTNNSRCFGFIYFHREDDAVRAKEAMNGANLDGREIRTDFSLTDKAHAPTPGRYMGRVTHRGPPGRVDRYTPGGGRYGRDYGRYDPYERSDRSRDRYYRDDRDRYDRDDRGRDRYERDRDRYRYRDERERYDRDYGRYDRGYRDHY